MQLFETVSSTVIRNIASLSFVTVYRGKGKENVTHLWEVEKKEQTIPSRSTPNFLCQLMEILNGGYSRRECIYSIYVQCSQQLIFNISIADPRIHGFEKNDQHRKKLYFFIINCSTYICPLGHYEGRIRIWIHNTAFTAKTLFRKLKTNIPRNETAQPRCQFLHSCIFEQFILIVEIHKSDLVCIVVYINPLNTCTVG